MHLEDAIKVITEGDGNDNPAEAFSVGSSPIGGTAGSLTYEALLDFWGQFDPYTMNTILVPNVWSFTRLLWVRTVVWGSCAPSSTRFKLFSSSLGTILVPNAVMLDMLKMSEFQNPLTGLNFQGTGTLASPLGATLLRTSAMPSGKLRRTPRRDCRCRRPR